MPAAQPYNPLDTQGYQPVQQPDNIKPPMESPFGGQPAPVPGGSVTHGGAIAGIFDGVLRGFVNGYATGEQHKALTLKKKSDDLNSSYNADAQRAYEYAKGKYATGEALDPNDPEYKKLQSAVEGSWGALNDFRGQMLQQQMGKKAGKKDADRSPAEVLADPKSTPQEKAYVVWKMSQQAGPPVAGQLQTLKSQFNSPQAMQARQTADTAAAGAKSDTEKKATLSTMANQIATLAAKEKLTPEEEKQFEGLKDRFTELNETLNPMKVPAGGAHRYSADGKEEYEVDQYGKEIENTRRPRSAVDRTPKVGTFGDFIAAAYGEHPTAKQTLEGRKLWAASAAMTTNGTHEIAVPQPDGSTKLIQVETTSTRTPAGGGGGAGLPSTRQDAGPSNPPTVVTQSFHGRSVPGLVEKGNVDIANRPNIDNGDGTHSSVFSMSFGTDKGEVLVPGVGDGKTYPARKLTEKEAWDQYEKTGQNLGTFKDVKSADAYGKTLHEDQAKYGSAPSSPPLTRRAKPERTVAPPTQESSGGHPKPGDTIGGKKTPTQTKADEDVVAATKLNSLAVQAVQSNEPGQQRQLALALIKGMAGRVNMQEYAIYTQKYGFANTVDGLVQGIESGRMPKAVVGQLARDAYSNLKAAKDAQAVAYNDAGRKATSADFLPKTVKMRAPHGGQTSDVPADQVEHFKSLGATVVGH